MTELEIRLAVVCPTDARHEELESAIDATLATLFEEGLMLALPMLLSQTHYNV